MVIKKKRRKKRIVFREKALVTDKIYWPVRDTKVVVTIYLFWP